MALEEPTVWLMIKDKVKTTVCLIKVELNSMGFTKKLKREDHTSFTLALLHLKRANCELNKLFTNLNTY